MYEKKRTKEIIIKLVPLILYKRYGYTLEIIFYLCRTMFKSLEKILIVQVSCGSKLGEMFLLFSFFKRNVHFEHALDHIFH